MSSQPPPSPLSASKTHDSLLTPSMNRKCFFIFFFLAALNNLSYEVILCYSNDLAKQFNKEDFMSSFSGCLVLFGICARFINSKLLLKVRHRTKNYIVIFSFVLGIAVLIISKYFNIFIFSLIGTSLLGIGCSLGDSNDLGFMKGLPSIVASGHSSGTGLSGVIGTTFYLLLKIFHFSFYAVVCSILFFYPFYALCFHLAVKFKLQWNERLREAKYEKLLDEEEKLKINEEIESIEDTQSKINKNDLEDNNMLLNKKEKNHTQVNPHIENNKNPRELEDEINAVEQQESQINQNMTWQNFKKVWSKSYSYIIGYFTLYILEYMANSWITSQIINQYSKKYNKEDPPFFIVNGFELALVVYRIFLFAGRSTLNLFKCRRFWLMIIGLLILDIIYFVHSLTGTVMTLVVMYINIVFIGFLGGVIFCNLIYISLENGELEKSEKEITLNLLTIFGDVGVLASSIVGLVVPKLLYD